MHLRYRLLLTPLTLLVIAAPGSGLAQERTATPAAPAATPASGSEVAVVWQIYGGPDRSFDDPFQLAIDSKGNLWVADGQNSRFQIFAPDGTFLDSWGTPGRGEGEFDFTNQDRDPSGAVAFDPAGNIYVADPGNHRVQKFDPNRLFLSSWGSEGTGPGQFLHPYDIAIDAVGRVYVIDDGRDDIQVFDGHGQLLATIAGPGIGEGRLFDTGSLAIAPDGSVWVADWGNYRVQKFSPDGAFLLAIGEPGLTEGTFNGPVDVAVDPQGHVFVVDTGNYRVQVFDQDGRFLTAFGSYGTDAGEFATPVGIAVDADGNLYVSDAGLDRVTRFALGPIANAGTPIP